MWKFALFFWPLFRVICAMCAKRTTKSTAPNHTAAVSFWPQSGERRASCTRLLPRRRRRFISCQQMRTHLNRDTCLRYAPHSALFTEHSVVFLCCFPLLVSPLYRVNGTLQSPFQRSSESRGVFESHLNREFYSGACQNCSHNITATYLYYQHRQHSCLHITEVPFCHHLTEMLGLLRFA